MKTLNYFQCSDPELKMDFFISCITCMHFPHASSCKFLVSMYDLGIGFMVVVKGQAKPKLSVVAQVQERVFFFFSKSNSRL